LVERSVMKNRAVIYCRVSTEYEIQESSLQMQIEQAKDAVILNGWELVDEFIDFGKTGTTTQNRIQYNRLVRNMKKDLFDIIVVKSQDRLMRSTKDWYIFIDLMVKYGIKLYFYMESMFYEPDDALLTGVKAILAEEFSRELSKKINNAHKSRQENGKIMLNSRTLGYINDNGKIVIDEAEAEIVRLIFQLRADGYGSYTIGKILTAKGYLNKRGNPIGQSTINNVLRNTIYYGTMTMNRRHYDFNTKKRVHNDASEWIVRENALPAIVDYELWKKANDLCDQKSKQFHVNVTSKDKRGSAPPSHPLSGKIICGLCGEPYHRSKQKRRNGYTLFWRCREYLYYGKTDTKKGQLIRQYNENYDRGCDNIQISDKDLKKVMLMIFEEIPEINAGVIDETTKITKQVMKEFFHTQKQKLDRKLHDNEKKKEILLDSLLAGNITKQEYQEKLLLISKERTEIIDKYQTMIENKVLEDKINTDRVKNHITKLINEDFAESFMNEHIKSIEIFPDHMILNFDFYEKINVSINRVNCHRKEFKIQDKNGLTDRNNWYTLY